MFQEGEIFVYWSLFVMLSFVTGVWLLGKDCEGTCGLENSTRINLFFSAVLDMVD